jgi:transposase
VLDGGGYLPASVVVSALKSREDRPTAVCFEAGPPNQMLVYFACPGLGRIPLLAFVPTSGYSWAELLWVKARQDEWAVIGKSIEAFDSLSGVLVQVPFDNAKTVVVARDAYADRGHRGNPTLLNFVRIADSP